MKNVTKKQLDTAIKKHEMCIKDPKKGVRLDFSKHDLSGANLSCANLSGANLSGANLTGANLDGANLSGANLSGAYLRGANLSCANLSGANLSGAYLRGAYLRDAILSDVYLLGANLDGAILSGANLRGADLPYYKIYPECGDFFAWKKLAGEVIAKVKIFDDSVCVQAISSRKIRTNKLQIVEMVDAKGGEINPGEKITCWGMYAFYYESGVTYEEPNLNTDIRLECEAGLHFFMTKEEAVNW